MAKRFADQFRKEPRRGYGGGVVDIFRQWLKHGVGDGEKVNKPSREQFNGSGSFGNGAAMRVAPVALFARSTEECIAVSYVYVVSEY